MNLSRVWFVSSFDILIHVIVIEYNCAYLECGRIDNVEHALGCACIYPATCLVP